MEKRFFITILDYNSGEVIVTEFDKLKFDADEIQEFYDYLNEREDTLLKDSECSYMITEEDVKITHF